MADTLTRRAAMTALAAGAAAVVPCAAAAGTVDRSAWNGALARYRQLDAEYRTASTAHDEAEGVYFERKKPEPCFVMEVEGDYGRFGKRVLPITILQSELDDPNRTWRDPERSEEFRRTLAAWRANDAALRKELRADELDEAAHDAMLQQSSALDALIATPAPDMAALVEKLQTLAAEFGDDTGGFEAVLADVRRLAGEGR